ncbi:MAG: DUF4169 family protein [Rhodobacteraceae bacterium]|nr:DUF4169 family protein [Paracoccaceae bacterium]
MGNVVNLRTARKQKNRESIREKKASMAKSAGVKARERDRVAKQNALSERAFEGHKREKDT